MTRKPLSAPAVSDMRCARVLRIVAAHKGVRRADMLNPTRSRLPIASARQLAMYLCHVMLGLNLTEVGRYFGRDRTTVSHACALIEDAREDSAVDREIEILEDAITGWMETGPCAGREAVADAAV